MREALARLRAWARRVLVELDALWLASRDPATPWFARVIVVLVVAYAFSPIDLIPDVIPVIGYLDDAILLPLGVLLARRLVPTAVLARCRVEAEVRRIERPRSVLGAILVVAVWLLVAGAVSFLVLRR